MTKSYTSFLIQKSDNGCLYLVTGKRDAKQVWCYLSVPMNKISLFLKALTAPSIDLAKFGKTIFSGTGATPPDEIKRIIQHHFVGDATT